MPLVKIRKIKLDIEEVHHEGGAAVAQPLLVAVAVAVVDNPYAGQHVDDLLPFMNELRALGSELSQRLI
ncbi:amino acid synthesis family protein, partial [Pseudomonas reidholzensis]